MKLSNISITNFKSIKNVELTFCDIMALVGRNNVGKSNIIEAIKLCLEPRPINNSYFRSGKNTGENIEEFEIKLKFLLEDDEKDDFLLYNIDDYLTIQVLEKAQKYSEGQSSTPKQKILSLLPNEDWLNCNKINKALINKYKKNDLELCNKTFEPCDDVDEWKRNAKKFFKEIIQNKNCEYHTSQEYVNIKELDNLHNRLPDCIYIPAIRHVTDDIKTTENSTLNKLLKLVIPSATDTDDIQTAIQNINNIFDPNNNTFSSIHTIIDSAMNDIFPECKVKIITDLPKSLPEFIKNLKIIVDDGVEEDNIDNKGTGLQRMLIFALLRSYSSEKKKTQNTRSTIFLIEEPEIYLHPNAQRSLYETLITIKKTDQVIYSTHSNLFINIEYHNEICIIRKNNGITIVNQYMKSYDNTFKTKGFITTFNEGFFADKIILVEGITDEIYLSLFHKYKKLPSLHRKNISLICCDGIKQIKNHMKIYEAFDIECYTIIDSDKNIDAEFCHRFNISSKSLQRSKSYDNGAIFAPEIESEIFNMPVMTEVLPLYLKSINKVSMILDNYDNFYNFIHKHNFAIFFSKVVCDKTNVKFPDIFEKIFDELDVK